jgi:quercetin dioxygenase-like cupin family protein
MGDTSNWPALRRPDARRMQGGAGMSPAGKPALTLCPDRFLGHLRCKIRRPGPASLKAEMVGEPRWTRMPLGESEEHLMSLILRAAALLLLLSPRPASAEDAAKAPVVVTPLLKADVTASGQPIVLPQGDPQVVVSTYEIAPGAKLSVHKHPYARYAYVLAGTLSVTNTETGQSKTYGPGDFIVEAIGQWHRGANIGPDPVKLLVIDQVEQGQSNVILRQ